MKVEKSNKITADALASLQASFGADPNDMGGPVSLASLVSSLSRIEDLLGSVTGSVPGTPRTLSLNESGSLGSWASDRSLRSNSIVPIYDGHRFPHRVQSYGDITSFEAERADRISRLAGLERVSRVRLSPPLHLHSKPLDSDIQGHKDHADTLEENSLSGQDQSDQNCPDTNEMNAGPTVPISIPVIREANQHRMEVEQSTVPLGWECLKCLVTGSEVNYVVKGDRRFISPEKLVCSECASPVQEQLRMTSQRDHFQSLMARDIATQTAQSDQKLPIPLFEKPYFRLPELNIYLESLHRRAQLRLQCSMLENMPWCFPSPDGSHDWSDRISTFKKELCDLEVEIMDVRTYYWKEGYNLDFIDDYIAGFKGYGPKSESSSGHGAHTNHGREKSTLEQLYRNEKWTQTYFSGNFAVGGNVAWAAKLDRINSWIFQTLRSSEREAQFHKSMLRTSLEEKGIHHHYMLYDDKEWSRKVLKHWLLDSAALVLQGSVLSTIGAVDSEGMRHDARVELNLEDLEG
jgi:hypothetical protein